MTSENFCHWLYGYLSRHTKKTLTETETTEIKKRIHSVFGETYVPEVEEKEPALTKGDAK